MNTRLRGLTCLFASLVGASAIAQQTRPVEEPQSVPESRSAAPQRAVPARTAPARPAETLAAGGEPVPADSVVGSLQTIVVLCATRPASEEFRTAWARYVRTHAVTGKDLDALIDDVLARAETYRAEHPPSARSSRMQADRQTTRAAMHETAKAAISNFR